MKNLIYWILLLSIVLLSCNDHVRDNPLDPQGTCYSVPAPEAPSLTSPADSTINISLTPTLTWSTVTSAVVYRVQVSTNSTFSSSVAADSLLTAVSQALSTTLATGTTYYWRVNAKNAIGTGEWSLVWCFSTALTVPTLTSPTNSATNISITPTLTWSTVNNAATYRVQVSTSSAFGSLVADDSTLSVGSKAITGLANSTAYYWRVNAKNSVSTSSWSSVGSFITVIAAPGIPTLSSPTNAAIIDATPTLTWSTLNNAGTYRVQVSTSSSFSSISEDDSLLTTASKALSATLAMGTTYYWRVCAKNAGGSSSWSLVGNFTTSALFVNNTVIDVDGNIYHTVKIGMQTWTVENLKTTHYNDGTAIANVTYSITWKNLTTGAYCWYNDSSKYKNTYGALYNWYAVNTGKLAPAGWHVSTNAEWDTLESYLIANRYNYDGTTTGVRIAKALAAQTNWVTNSEAGTIGADLSSNNRSGFSALPGGYCWSDGSFLSTGYVGYWWSATESNASSAYYRDLACSGSTLYSNYLLKSCGFSVRLVRD